MFVKDYMTQDLHTVTPTTSVQEAQDLMEKYQINRLPVMESGKLLGLVTRESLSKAMPSEATSLSIYEVNYLLAKMTCKDVMVRKVSVIEPETLLTEAAAKMRDLDLGVHLVMEGEDLKGIITDKDIFKAFIDIAGYNAKGTTLVIELSQDRQGVIEEIGDALVEADENLTHMVVYHREGGSLRLVLQVDKGNTEALIASLEKAGYLIHGIY